MVTVETDHSPLELFEKYLQRESIFLPGISKSIRDMVKACTICNRYQPAQPKLQMKSVLLEHHWETIGTDIFEQNGCKYLLVVDYYLRFLIINNFKTHRPIEYARYSLRSQQNVDYPQQLWLIVIMSEKFKKECHSIHIAIKPSSPYHHQANGVAKRTVGTIKAIRKKAHEKKCIQCITK